MNSDFFEHMSHETQILNIDGQVVIAIPKTCDVEFKQELPNMNLSKLQFDSLKLFGLSMRGAIQIAKEPHHGRW